MYRINKIQNILKYLQEQKTPNSGERENAENIYFGKFCKIVKQKIHKAEDINYR